MTNSSPSSTDVLIVGAGAAGLTLGVDLARRGVAFRLIEKLPGPFDGSRGKGIQPRSQEVFEDLGVLDHVMAAGGLYPTQRHHQPDGTFVDKQMAQVTPPTPAEPYHWALMIPQFATERILRERLAELGGAVEFGVELTGFEQDGGGVTAHLSTGEIVRARYLVGADGGRSFVRKALDVGFPGGTLGVRAFGADVELTGLDRDYWHQFGEGDMARQIGFGPLPGTDLYQLQGPVPMEGEIDLSAEGLNALIRERTGREDIVVTRVGWASAFVMSARRADRYRVGSVFLIGDAAHVHPPTGGQGLNTSVQDAYNLGWKLGAVLAGAPDAVLESYEAERRPIAQAMLGLSKALLEKHKQGDERRGREVHQLDLTYRGSPLALDLRGSALAAGDRAPDAPIMGAAGQPARLFQLFAGPHWTLLLGGEAPTPDARRGLRIHRLSADLIDSGGHVVDAYGLAPGDWVLVRPDGYVGAAGRAGDAEALSDYLAGVGL